MSILLFFIGFLACSNTEQPTTKPRKTTTYSTAKGKEDNSVFVDKSGTLTEKTSREPGDIIERHKKMGKNPADVIALWIEAAIRAQNGEKGAMEALGYLTVIYKKDKSWRTESHLLRKIKDKSPCFRSFVVGATPENGYEVDLDNIRIQARDDKSKSADGMKWFVTSSGADTPRPVHLKKSSKTGLYFLNNFSSLHVDVKPAITDEETFE